MTVRIDHSRIQRSVDPRLDGFTDLEITSNAKNPCANFTDARVFLHLTIYINTYMYIMIHFTVSNLVILVQRFTGLCSKIYVYVYLY